MDINKILKYALIAVLLLPVLLFGIVLPIAGLGEYTTHKQPSLDKDPLFTTTSGTCIQQGLQKHPNRNGTLAWENLKGGKNSGHSGLDALPIFEDAARRYQVPLALLLAVGEQESTFDQRAVSPANAVGTMQMIPETFSSTKSALLNSGLGPQGIGEISDTKSNIYVGSFLLSKYWKRYNGDINRIGSAYNAGVEDRVVRNTETVNWIKEVTIVFNAIRDCQSNTKQTIPANASETGKRVIAASQKLAGNRWGVNCYDAAIKVYDEAGVRPVAVKSSETWGNPIKSVAPQPGYLMDIPTGDSQLPYHTVIFDHAEGDIWYFWSADVHNPWQYTDQPYRPGSGSPRVPYNPTKEGYPIHMWEPVAK